MRCVLRGSFVSFDLFFRHEEHQERQRTQSHIKIAHKNYRTYKGVTQWKMIELPQPLTKTLNYKFKTRLSQSNICIISNIQRTGFAAYAGIAANDGIIQNNINEI
jgi:hypothetical protein